jgi:YfiH family protein
MGVMSMDAWFEPDWPAPASIRAVSTLRTGGLSAGAYASFNLGDHVGDDPAHVSANRQRLCEGLALNEEPMWLAQVHGLAVASAGSWRPGVEADACVSSVPGKSCVVLTADCLPVLLCDQQGQRVAAAHAGWRGLVSGVLERTVRAMGPPGEQLMAWLGPAIGQGAFEVGEDVRLASIQADPGSVVYFAANPRGRWQADLYGLARRRLEAAGVKRVFGGGYCTASDPQRYFSYRRDGQCGRMATLVWIQG